MAHGDQIPGGGDGFRRFSTCGLALKSLNEAGRFAGYASVFGVVDQQRDVVMRGAFLRSLSARKGEVKLLWQHDSNAPIGVIDRLFEDTRGLYIEGKLLLNVQQAKEAYSLLKAGVVAGLSIGYLPVNYHIDPETGVRVLTEVDLFEVSLVTFPANQAAGVTVVKSATATPALPEHRAAWDAAVRSGQAIALADALDRAMKTLER